jgi:putative membrane protein
MHDAQPRVQPRPGMNSRVRTGFLHFGQGLLMGSADIIPGVSGGTMALIVGIYERLIASLTRVFSALLALLRGKMSEFRDHLGHVEWSLIIPLAVGIGSALMAGAMIIPFLLDRFPEQMRGLFFGLIAASLAIPWLRAGRMGRRELGIAVAGAVVAFVLVGLPPREIASPSLVQVFGAASVAICAMILPGVSGAFLLLVLGMYTASLRAINAQDLLYIATFMAGAAVGLGIFSRLLNWLLKNHHDATMAALIGLMAGSLRALWPWLADDRSMQGPAPGDPIAAVVLLGLAGFAFVTLLTWMGARRIAAAKATASQPSGPAARPTP